MTYRLFEVFGIELEYAVVRADTLAIAPEVDVLLSDLGGGPDDHPALGNVEGDNELAAHVFEIKCKRPCADLPAQATDFQAYVEWADRALAKRGLRLMPGGMHPFMDPARESKLWPHEDSPIYAAYDRVFGCRGHGWFNIQSVHLNLPFSGDAEFSRLHNAVSLLLPVLPALAASSPIYDGAHHGWLDGRLFHYAGNQKKLASISGPLVPEPAGSEQEYRDGILAPMFRDIAPFDPEGLLQEEWLNSRAAIARFERSAIEIRCMDTQENPAADVALCAFAVAALRRAVAEGGDLLALHRRVPEGALRALFLECARAGGAARMPEGYPFAAFGVDAQATAGGFLAALKRRAGDAFSDPVIERILREGNLAERILRAASAPGAAAESGNYPAVYARLCDCLESGRPFH